MIRFLGLALLLAAACPASAHRSSDAFVTLLVSEGQVQGRWEISLRDLEVAVGLDHDRNDEVTWGELQSAQPRLAGLLRHLAVSDASGACALRMHGLKVNDRSDGPYAWIDLAGSCPGTGDGLAVRYGFMFGVDPTHRAILSVGTGTQVTATAVLSPSNERFSSQQDGGGRGAQFASYVREGVVHIWIGLDHILFLVALLLPCVLRWQDRAWTPATRFPEVLREVVVVVTAFTAAHTLTLGLAVFELVSLPSRWVESVIALTVILAALNNLYPVVTARRYAVACGLGLIHGFGFASVLGDVGLPSNLRVLGLAGFNIGVELGQLAIVAALVPLLYALRSSNAYRLIVLQGGSLCVAALAGIWFFQRAFLGE